MTDKAPAKENQGEMPSASVEGEPAKAGNPPGSAGADPAAADGRKTDGASESADPGGGGDPLAALLASDKRIAGTVAKWRKEDQIDPLLPEPSGMYERKVHRARKSLLRLEVNRAKLNADLKKASAEERGAARDLRHHRDSVGAEARAEELRQFGQKALDLGLTLEDLLALAATKTAGK
jgi:hypothetical protein